MMDYIPHIPLVRIALIVPTIIIIYWFWIRPILKSTPKIVDLHDAEQSWTGALGSKFGGIKQKLIGTAIFISSVVVELYDYVAPLLGGIDLTPITSYVPGWAWPIISIGAVLLLNYMRVLGDRRNAVDADVVQSAFTGKPVDPNVESNTTPKAG